MVLLSASGPSLVAKADKESACQCRRHRDMGSIARSGRRSPEGGNGYPLQYSWLKNFMDRGACWATVYWAQRADTTECEPPNHASQVFVLLLECYVFGKKKKKFSSLNQSTSLFCFCEYTNFERLFVCSCVFISMTLWISAFLTSLLIQKLPFVFIVCTWTLKI